MRNKGLTPRQKIVLEAIKQFIAENQYSPTVAEIAELIESKSMSPIHGHLENLKEKGFISWVPHSARTIRILKELPHEQQA